MEDMGGKQLTNGQQPENNNSRPPPAPPQTGPQQCPRCNSFNTKFCYYNNYSLSQPRYFCKSCRRYWTQGGTLRNVPVGGGCRKGAKRLVKGLTGHASSSCSSTVLGECSRPQEQQIPLPPPTPTHTLPSSPSLPPLPPRGFSNMALPFPNSFYSPSALLSSFAAMQNLNRPQGGFNQVPLNGGGGSSNSPNISVLQGFSAGNNPNIMMRAQPQLQQQQIYRTVPDAQMMVQQQPSRSFASWTQGFINNPNSASNSTTVSWAQSMLLQPNNNIPATDEAAMNNQNQWPDHHDVDEVDHLPGYGPPPPSS